MWKKSEVLDKLKLFKAETENATDAKIKRLRSDNGMGGRFEEFYSKHDIKHETSVPYTP